MSKKYYKVVLNSKGKLFSCIRDTNFFGGNNFKSKYAIEYKVGEWVRPNVDGSQLMVFKFLNDAKIFARNHSLYDIYKCEISGITKKSVFIRYTSLYYNMHRIRDLWKKKKNRKKINHYMDLPPSGTIFCSAVKLIEREPF